MRIDVVAWICNNHRTISILWEGVKLSTQLFLGAYFPTEIELPNMVEASAIYADAEDYEVADLYELVSDALDAISAMNEEKTEYAEAEDAAEEKGDEAEEDVEDDVKEEKENEIFQPINDMPEDKIEKNATEEMIDEIEKVDAINTEKYVSEAAMLRAEETAEEMAEAISTEHAMALFETYYYSHGQSEQLSEELSAY